MKTALLLKWFDDESERLPERAYSRVKLGSETVIPVKCFLDERPPDTLSSSPRPDSDSKNLTARQDECPEYNLAFSTRRTDGNEYVVRFDCVFETRGVELKQPTVENVPDSSYLVRGCLSDVHPVFLW